MAGNKSNADNTPGVVADTNNPSAANPGAQPAADDPPIPTPTTNPGRDRVVLQIPVNTSAVSSTFAERKVNDTVRKLFKGNIDESSAAEIIEKLNQIVPAKTLEGRTGTQFEYSPLSSGAASTAGQSVAQTSLFERAQASLSDAQKRLGALRPMQTPSDPEDLEALRTITLTTYKRLVNELGQSDGPRNERVEAHFTVLIGSTGTTLPANLAGLLGKIETQFKIKNARVISPEDSANVANFRIVKDNLFDVFNSWKTFITERATDVGEKAARFSRFLVMIQDDVTDVENAMDEIDFDSTDREGKPIATGDDLTIQGLLSWIAEFAAEEAPEMVDEGGAIGIVATIPIIEAIFDGVDDLTKLDERPVKDEPNVQASLGALKKHIVDALGLANSIKPTIEPSPQT